MLHALSRAVADLATSTTDVLIGIADGAFAAEQATRRGLVIPHGGSPQFLADLPVSTLDPSGNSPLIGLLRRLGLRTLGAFAELPARDVLARFGPEGRMGASAGRRMDDRRWRPGAPGGVHRHARPRTTGRPGGHGGASAPETSPNASSAIWLSTAWPAPAWSCRRRARTARRRYGAGGTPAC